MHRTLKFKQALFALALSLSLALLALLPSATVPGIDGVAEAQAGCTQVSVPALTHGFSTSPELPVGDHFILPDPFTLTVVPGGTPMPGFNVFNVNAASFGGYPGTNPQGFSYSTPGGRVTLLSCLDGVWDLGFVLASSGATVGDTVTYFLQGTGGGTTNLAVFTYEAGGVRLTSIHPQALLFLEDRFANKPRLFVGELIPFSEPAGASGLRTRLLVLALEMRPDSPFNTCAQFGVTIAHSSGTGTTSVVITDVILRRQEQAGDRARAGSGLLRGLTGGFPTAPVCPTVCPPCQPPPPPPPPPVPDCPTLYPIPIVTHGFTTSPTLPAGDHFLLPDPYNLAVISSAAGFSTFTPNATNFGGNAAQLGALAGANPLGFSYTTPNGTLTAVGCLDSVWDLAFLLASNGATVGDRVTIFVRSADGSTVINVAVFTYEAGGVRVTSLHPNVLLFTNDRFASKPRVFASEFIAFAAAAGTAGSRTPLLVLAFEMRPDSPLNACYQFGVSVARGRGTGTVSAVITDILMKRMETTGDRARPGAGLLGGLTGGFPTGLVCPTACPRCPPPPTIVCPPNQTVCAPAGATAANVTWPRPTTTGDGVSVSCNPMNGSSFPLGVSTVTCTAVNAGGSASCTFTVSVNAAPTIVCPPNQVVCAPAGATSATATWPRPTTTGLNTTVSCSPMNGSSFPVGTSTVNCTATNECGTATCSFTVRVIATPAIAACPSNITTTAATVGGTAVVTYTTPTATPAGIPVTCSPASGTAFAVGTTTVTCSATNECGTARCTFTVTVENPFKCDTFCLRSPQWWLLNLNRLPRGEVLISGVNSNIPIGTYNVSAIQQALRGNPTGVGFSPQQIFNREYVAAQLNLLLAGGGGSPTFYNVMWANLSCHGITFPPVTLSNGFTLSTSSMVKDLYMQAQLATTQNRSADFAALAVVFDLLNGNNPLGVCN